ncbi:MAG TPA: sigma-70 family RNA polymerase sigma factor [Vicinamibacteria bacterium]|jgi:RNA polymerase sigma-70 factor (ECF subfamily)
MARTDEELVAAFQAGDRDAFDELVARWDGKISGAIQRVVGSGEDVRDVSQEVFLKAYRALGGFKQEARFSSWLYQIALNACRDRLRRRRRRPQVPLDEAEEAVASATAASPDPLDAVLARDLRQAVAEAVAALPEEQREVIVLKEYQGLTFVEVAEALELPLSTVKTRLYRGLHHMRQSLERRGIHAAEAVPAALP